MSGVSTVGYSCGPPTLPVPPPIHQESTCILLYSFFINKGYKKIKKMFPWMAKVLMMQWRNCVCAIPLPGVTEVAKGDRERELIFWACWLFSFTDWTTASGNSGVVYYLFDLPLFTPPFPSQNDCPRWLCCCALLSTHLLHYLEGLWKPGTLWPMCWVDLDLETNNSEIMHVILKKLRGGGNPELPLR